MSDRPILTLPSVGRQKRSGMGRGLIGRCKESSVYSVSSVVLQGQDCWGRVTDWVGRSCVAVLGFMGFSLRTGLTGGSLRGLGLVGGTCFGGDLKREEKKGIQ